MAVDRQMRRFRAANDPFARRKQTSMSFSLTNKAYVEALVEADQAATMTGVVDRCVGFFRQVDGLGLLETP